MSTTRFAIIRYQTIDQCLQQSHKKWNYRTLSEACAKAIEGVYGEYKKPSRSTIDRDIKAMQSARPIGYDAPIVWDAVRGTYYYEESGFSIHRAPLTQKDIDLLDEALQLLRSARYFRQEAGLEALAKRLTQSLQLKRKQQNAPTLFFNHAEAAAGLQWINLLYEAARKEQCLQLHYQPFQEKQQIPVISPYLLKEYNRRWFLIGYSHQQKLIRTYALDRIQKAEVYLLEKYYRKPDFDPVTHFDHIVGVSIPEEGSVERILLRTTPLRAKYMQTKPIHQSQRLLEDRSDHCLFSLHLIPNFELERLLLSFGEDIQILEPQWLVQKLKDHLTKALQQYTQ